ncbi:hypothetical protein CEXT_140531 [Caerostris extrusa]|uniref:Uncharacterized protein n=1 Tax=Caerostris extrusa TaxID=172846 RepID=A0AAV4YBF0_CAEEX|nr:hypothetical protein CEXT_140531 [Caerostris extrusa]
MKLPQVKSSKTLLSQISCQPFMPLTVSAERLNSLSALNFKSRSFWSSLKPHVTRTYSQRQDGTDAAWCSWAIMMTGVNGREWPGMLMYEATAFYAYTCVKAIDILPYWSIVTANACIGGQDAIANSISGIGSPPHQLPE